MIIWHYITTEQNKKRHTARQKGINPAVSTTLNKLDQGAYENGKNPGRRSLGQALNKLVHNPSYLKRKEEGKEKRAT